MPFGSMFGALFFGGLCPWLGLRLLLSGDSPNRMAGACLLVLGPCLAVGLLTRRGWARWLGGAAAVLVALAALGPLGTVPDATRLVVLLGGGAAAALLAVPATGRVPGQGAAAVRSRASVAGRALGAVAAVAVAGFAGAAWLVAPQAGETATAERDALPAAAILRRVGWTDFGTGLERARAEDKPVLVYFLAPWCPYCKKMDRTTWKAAPVLERMQQVVPVRVDAEETRERNGYRGTALATRYRVSGFPTVVLLDAAGRPLARADGFLASGQFVTWFDDAMPRTGAASSRAAGGRAGAAPGLP